jgi:hypothetical protein
LAEGHRIFYEREVPFELRSADGVEEPQEVGALEVRGGCVQRLNANAVEPSTPGAYMSYSHWKEKTDVRDSICNR